MTTNLVNRALLATVSGYVFLLIVLPIGSIFEQAFAGGIGAFLHSLTSPIGLAALRVSLETSLVAACINTAIGTLIAFAFVRFTLPGKAILNAIVDLPFAIPTTVSGLMLILFYGPTSVIGRLFAAHGIKLIYSTTGIVLAMVFITFPLTVRAVQPVLEEIEPAMEEAARTLGASSHTIFRRILIPAMLPGILTGFAMTFSRSLAEFGSVVMVSGNLPMHTQIAPVYIYGQLENDNPQGADAMSVVLLLLSFLMLFLQVDMHKISAVSWRNIWRRNANEGSGRAV